MCKSQEHLIIKWIFDNFHIYCGSHGANLGKTDIRKNEQGRETQTQNGCVSSRPLISVKYFKLIRFLVVRPINSRGASSRNDVNND